MHIDITRALDQVDWNAVADLFVQVGWGRRDPLRVERAFSHSTVVCFSYHDRRLIGCGRALSDGEFYATIFDVLVHPSYQAQGLGRRMMTMLLEPLQGLIFVHLTATPGNEPFYRKFGFRKQKTAMVLVRNPEAESMRPYLEAE